MSDKDEKSSVQLLGLLSQYKKLSQRRDSLSEAEKKTLRDIEIKLGKKIDPSSTDIEKERI